MRPPRAPALGGHAATAGVPRARRLSGSGALRIVREPRPAAACRLITRTQATAPATRKGAEREDSPRPPAPVEVPGGHHKRRQRPGQQDSGQEGQPADPTEHEPHARGELDVFSGLAAALEGTW